MSFTTSDGELFIYADFILTDASRLLEKPLQPSPFIHDALSETSGNARKVVSNGYKDATVARE